jgi:hypothetical protein
MSDPRRRARHGPLPLVAIACGLLLVLAAGGSPGAASPPPDRPVRAPADPDRFVAQETPVPEPTPEPTPSPEPTPTPPPWSDLQPPPAPGRFSIDLYRPGVMASQAEAHWCVPAAMLTMVNLMSPDPPDTSRAAQRRLYRLARLNSTDRLTGKGAEPEGWARVLEQEGFGRFIVHVTPTRKGAIKEAARALRFTGRPVGLLTWRGAHSWVMTGFRATADPAYTPHFRVTAVTIADVWWPRISTIWGPSDPPGTVVPFDRLDIDYLPWWRPEGPYPDKDGKFVLVIPVRDDGRYDPSQPAG